MKIDIGMSRETWMRLHRMTQPAVIATLAATLMAVLAAQAISQPSPRQPPQPGRFTVTLDEVPIAGLPPLQSYALGQANGRWLVVGGRKDGLHKRRPFETFRPSGNSTQIHVIDIATATVWSKSLDGLPTTLVEQLQSTNMEFHQLGDRLYLIGGYGYSDIAGDHVTHGFLTAIDVPGAITAIIGNAPLAPHIRQMPDERMAVTGGYLGELDGVFYLAGGQRFTGRYNPMGPDHGPGFIQEYTNEVRRFTLRDDGRSMAIDDYSAWRDAMLFHRRDYNMAPQIFPDGTPGFTIFSGVFQHDQDLPWLNLIDIRADGYNVVPAFEQLLSHYHCAHVSLLDVARNEMHNIFLGGMAQFTPGADGALVEDSAVPFVKTISMVTRHGDGSVEEYTLGQLPAFIGTGAEFIPGQDMARESNGVLRLPVVPDSGVVIGHVLGGIESSMPNAFFSGHDNATVAAAKLYRVTLRTAS